MNHEYQDFLEKCLTIGYTVEEKAGGITYIRTNISYWYIKEKEGVILLFHKNTKHKSTKAKGESLLDFHYQKECKTYKEAFSYLKGHDKAKYTNKEHSKASSQNKKIDKLFDKIKQ